MNSVGYFVQYPRKATEFTSSQPVQPELQGQQGLPEQRLTSAFAQGQEQA
jgi:hypothetical protein